MNPLSPTTMATSTPTQLIAATCLSLALAACASPELPLPTPSEPSPAASRQLTLEQVRELPPIPRLFILSEDQLGVDESENSPITEFIGEQLRRAELPQAFELWIRRGLEDIADDQIEFALRPSRDSRTSPYSFLQRRDIDSPGVDWIVGRWGLRPALACTISTADPSLREQASQALERAGVPYRWRHEGYPWEAEETPDWPYAYLSAIGFERVNSANDHIVESDNPLPGYDLILYRDAETVPVETDTSALWSPPAAYGIFPCPAVGILRFLRRPRPVASFQSDPQRRLLGEAAALLWERWIPFGWTEGGAGAVLEVPADLIETAAEVLNAEPHLRKALLGP